MVRSPDRDVLSVDEVQDSIYGLDEEAHLLIGRAAGRLVAVSPFFDEPSDLINEALVALLEGRRRIPRSEKVVAVFVMVMRSIASHAQETRVQLVSVEAVGDLECDRPTPEAEALATEQGGQAAFKVAALRAAFADDEAVNAVLMAYEEEMSLPEVGESLGISHKDLEAGRKRLSRWIERQGWKNDR